MATLADLERQMKEAEQEFAAFNQELTELQAEYRENRVFLHEATRFTEPADVVAARSALETIGREAPLLEEKRDEAARTLARAQSAYHFLFSDFARLALNLALAYVCGARGFGTDTRS